MPPAGRDGTGRESPPGGAAPGGSRRATRETLRSRPGPARPAGAASPRAVPVWVPVALGAVPSPGPRRDQRGWPSSPPGPGGAERGWRRSVSGASGGERGAAGESPACPGCGILLLVLGLHLSFPVVHSCPAVHAGGSAALRQSGQLTSRSHTSHSSSPTGTCSSAFPYDACLHCALG